MTRVATISPVGFTFSKSGVPLTRRQATSGKRIATRIDVKTCGFGPIGTRVISPYQVQHTGFGEDASTAYGGKTFRPYWTMRPYWSHEFPGRVIQVEGFDVLSYAELANTLGGLCAPGVYIEKKGVPWIR